MQRAGRTENRHLRHAQRGGDVHQAGVIADGGLAAGNQAERLRQRCLSRQVMALARLRCVYGRGNLIAQRRFLGRTQQHDRQIKLRGQFRKVRGGPALRGAEFSAGGKDVIAAAPQAQFPQGVFDLLVADVQLRPVALQVAVATERRIKRHHGRPVFRIFQPVRQQADTRFTEIADAPGNTGQKRQQDAFERVGQHVGRVELPLQTLGQGAARLELQSTVRKRKLDHLGHLRHGAVHRRHPRQCAHGEPFAARVQAAQQRLGHHRVAYPLRGDDERVSEGARRRWV